LNGETKKIPRIYKIFDFFNNARRTLIDPGKSLTPIYLKID